MFFQILTCAIFFVFGAVVTFIVIKGVHANETKNYQKRISDMESEVKDLNYKVDVLTKFVPLRYLQMFEISDLSKIQMGQRDEADANIFSFNVYDFSEIIKQIDVATIHMFINQIMQECVPVIDEYGGAVENFEEAGVTAVFTNSSEKTLESAIVICENMSRNYKNKPWFDLYATAIVYGNVTAGLVGYDNRLSVLTMSAYTNLASDLLKICHKYYCKIVVTGTFADRIDDFENKYNSRFIGYIYIKNINKIERLIDVFDGDVAEVRNMKRKTKKMFETGIMHFNNQNITDARHNFIEVMKLDKNDKASIEYIRLCDMYLKGEKEFSQFIDIY